MKWNLTDGGSKGVREGETLSSIGNRFGGIVHT